MPAASTLTPDEIARFDERGYHLHGRVFSDAEVDAINQAAMERWAELGRKRAAEKQAEREATRPTFRRLGQPGPGGR